MLTVLGVLVVTLVCMSLGDLSRAEIVWVEDLCLVPQVCSSQLFLLSRLVVATLLVRLYSVSSCLPTGLLEAQEVLVVHWDSLVMLCRQRGSQRLLAGILVVLERWLLQCPLVLHQHRLYILVVPTPLHPLRQTIPAPGSHSSQAHNRNLLHNSPLNPLSLRKSRARLF